MEARNQIACGGIIPQYHNTTNMLCYGIGQSKSRTTIEQVRIATVKTVEWNRALTNLIRRPPDATECVSEQSAAQALPFVKRAVFDPNRNLNASHPCCSAAGNFALSLHMRKQVLDKLTLAGRSRHSSA